jgi:hypothetical protein
MAELVEITEEDRKKAVANAVMLVTRNNPKKVIQLIATLMTENMKLTADNNRLRALTGEELLPQYKL